MLAAARAAAEATNDASVLPPIVVTGQKPPPPQTETTALTLAPGEEFGRGQVYDTRELTGLAPNLSAFDGNNNRDPHFSLRGMRELNFAIGEPSVAVYVDDVALTDLAARGVPLFDLDRIEVLRGPQGTLFGATAPGGVINIHTRPPDNTFEGYAAAGYGNYNAVSTDVALRGPIVTNALFLGVSGHFDRRDGFVENIVTGDHPDTQRTLDGRMQLRWKPAEPWEVSFFATADQWRDGMTATYVPGQDPDWFKVARNLEGFTDTDSYGQALRVGYENADVRVTSATAHRTWSQNLSQDFDFSAADIITGFSNPEVTQWSEELHLQSPDETQLLRWLAGGYFCDRKKDNNFGSVLVPFALNQQTLALTKAQTWAGFGQLTWTAVESLDLVGGVRVTDDTRSIDRQGLVNGAPTPGASYTASLHDTDVQPKAGLAWQATERAQLYASFTTGYQPGGFNPSSGNAAQSQFERAHSLNYELGAKTDWLDKRLFVDAALFYTEVSDYQTYYVIPPNGTETVVLNADAATLYGAELTLTARPARGWELSCAAGYTHARYDQFTNPLTGANLDGNTISFVPEFTLNAAAQYRFASGLFARTEVTGVGQYYFTDGNTASQSPFALLNAAVGYEQKNWSLRVYGRNLTDEHYASNGLEFGPGFVVLQPGNPRTFGVVLDVHF
jgi:iron complex outermembrane receptor protein